MCAQKWRRHSATPSIVYMMGGLLMNSLATARDVLDHAQLPRLEYYDEDAKALRFWVDMVDHMHELVGRSELGVANMCAHCFFEAYAGPRVFNFWDFIWYLADCVFVSSLRELWQHSEAHEQYCNYLFLFDIAWRGTSVGVSGVDSFLLACWLFREGFRFPAGLERIDAATLDIIYRGSPNVDGMSLMTRASSRKRRSLSM